ncbi:MAG: hypothetical protein RIR67_1198 [Bacteroidota bacterium]|jgi:hypothetical protein
MKKITVAFLLLGAFMAKAQDAQSIEALKESVDAHSMKFDGLEERLATSDADLAKLTKIKVSGYIQAQYDAYDTWTAAGVQGISTSTGSANVTNSFFLRRARIKFAYDAGSGVSFVLQPDFSFDKVSLKDAYVALNDRWTKTFTLFLGQFDRPNYEVEYSSGSMEMLERTKMAGILYPGEKELGAKLEANFDTKYNFPLKLQLAVMNGNFNLGTTTNQVKDVDNTKDVMARAVYSVKLPNAGLGIDFGGHGYFGKTEVLPGTTLTGFTDVNGVAFTPVVGDKLDKSWLGAEMQIYYDLLGGMALKAEYISGTLSGVGSNAAYANNNSGFKVAGLRNFSGYYATLIKNIGKSHQFIARYDEFDPNTKLSGDAVTNANDLKYNTMTLSWQYFFDDNIKVVAGYSMPINEKTAGITTGDYANRDKVDNQFSIRIQAKF